MVYHLNRSIVSFRVHCYLELFRTVFCPTHTIPQTGLSCASLWILWIIWSGGFFNVALKSRSPRWSGNSRNIGLRFSDFAADFGRASCSWSFIFVELTNNRRGPRDGWVYLWRICDSPDLVLIKNIFLAFEGYYIIKASKGLSFLLQFMVVTVLGVFGVLVRSRAVVELVPELARATILRLRITEMTAQSWGQAVRAKYATITSTAQVWQEYFCFNTAYFHSHSNSCYKNPFLFFLFFYLGNITFTNH